MSLYDFKVPESKRVRLIIHTDCKNEADDQYAVIHQLLTPMLDVRGIIAGHFEKNNGRYPAGTSAQASFDEIVKITGLIGAAGRYPIRLGASAALRDERTPVPAPGVELIISEAMRDDPRPLFIGMQGAITDLASAILTEPRICGRMTAIWIGGGDYPDGGEEFNLMQDINAANVVFSSSMPLWQVTRSVYKQFALSLAELQVKVKPCGKIGAYLFRQLVELNDSFADVPVWPHGETWALGDQGVIAALMQEQQRTDNYTVLPAPNFDPVTMKYVRRQTNRDIRVYHSLDVRATLEDLFAKLRIFSDSEQP